MRFRFADRGIPDQARLAGAVIATTPSENLLSDLGRAEIWAIAEFFDLAFPVIDHALRRLLRFERFDYEPLCERALRMALRFVLDGQAESRDERDATALGAWIHFCGEWAATRVAFTCLQSQEARAQFAVEDDSQGRRSHPRLELERIHRIFSEMSMAEAELLVLVDVFGYHTSELGVRMSCRQSQVQSRLHRARQRFACEPGRVRAAP